MKRTFNNIKQERILEIDSFVRRLMKKEGLNQTNMANVFGKTQSWFSRNLREGGFTTDELLTIFYILKAEPEMVGRLLVISRSAR